MVLHTPFAKIKYWFYMVVNGNYWFCIMLYLDLLVLIKWFYWSIVVFIGGVV